MRSFQVRAACGHITSRSYAKAHNQLCKACATGEETTYRCPDCGEKRLTAFQKNHGYHCDSCTRNADPVGYANEVRGFYD